MKSIIIYCAIIVLSALNAQVSVDGTPYSFKYNVRADVSVEVIPDEVDVDALLFEDEVAGKDVPFRFGHPFDVNLNLENSGEWETTENGGRVWRLGIESTGAYSINLIYDDFWLPEGGKFYVYNADNTQIIGAFSTLNNKEDSIFATAPVAGDHIILEYNEPADSPLGVRIQISSVIHAYKNIFGFHNDRGYGDSGSCNNNANCPEGADWENEVRAAAMILTGGGSRLCSGSLINNVRQDMTQYFLTANHCLGGESSWMFMFIYESPGCQNQGGPTNQTVQGSTLLANNSGSDFGLLRLTETIPESYDVNYAGWDATGNTPSTPVCIHHPSGDIKKITFDYDNASDAGSYWDIDSWDDGTTEPGSSGSPLYDGQSHRIVGQLYGGVASCTNFGYDTYGKVSVSWNSGLSQYLDPDNTGTTVLDGIDMAAQAEMTNYPSSFEVSLSQDQSLTSTLEISNIGEDESTLFYNIGVSPFENVGGGPDDNGNLWADSDDEASIPAEWIDITGVGTQYSFPHNDEAGDPISIGFDFTFYGQSYSQCIVNANGWVGFGSDNNAWDNLSIPNSSAPGPAIFGFWDDLNPVNDSGNEYSSGNVYYHSNSERFLISFNEIAHWWTNNENSYYSFQVVLYPSGDVNLNYGPITGTHSATIGMQNTNGNDGLQVSYNGSYAHDGLSVRFTKEPSWVSVSPDQGEVGAGNSESIAVTFSSSGLTNGEYTANMNISSNGGSATLPVTLTVSGETQSMPVTYFDGWNLIGLPLAADETNYLSLFPDALEGTLYAFDGIYQEVSQLMVGGGYWLRFSQQGSSSIEGSLVNSLSISLSEGWNMISGISSSIAESDISDPNSILITGTLYGYNGTYYNASSIDPGNGYWIRAGSSGSISLSGSGLARRNIETNENLLSELSSLIFINSNGLSNTLYCGMAISENEKLSFSLPPVPPAGGFDVRFSGDMRLTENGGEVFIQNEFWPMHVKLVIIEDRSEKVEWVFVDEVNGKEYSFNESGAVEISEPTERLTLHRNTLTPEHFALYQNYPNPFNPLTTISFSVGESENLHTSLQIFDVTGRLVETLVSGKLVSGSYTVNWDASNVSSGVYIYKLISGKSQITKKMILLK